MLNAARNALINLPGIGVELDPFGAYSDPAYRPAPLASPLQAVADALYNGSTDRGLRNYFARLYLQLLHASPYADHLLLDDPRLTYTVPFDTATLPAFGVYTTLDPGAPAAGAPPAADLGPLAWNLSRRRTRAAWRRAEAAPAPAGIAPPPIALYLAGAPTRRAGLRRIQESWTVTVPAAGTVAVTHTASGEMAAQGLTFLDGLSASFPFPRSPMAGRIPQYLGAGTTWRVAALLQPAEGLPEILARLDGLHADSLVALFGAPATGVYATYQALFRDAGTLPERLAGALLALIRQTSAAAG